VKSVLQEGGFHGLNPHDDHYVATQVFFAALSLITFIIEEQFYQLLVGFFVLWLLLLLLKPLGI
jgi:hypothetical protein